MKKLKKILLPLATAILVIAISIGATLAYLMDEATADNVMTVGKIDIELLEYERIDTETKNADAKVQEFTPDKPLLPSVIEKGFDYTPGDTYVDWEQNDDEGNVIKPDYTSPIWDPAKISNEVDKMVFVENTGDYNAYVRVFFAFEAGNYTTKTLFDDKIHINLNDKDWKWEWIPFLATDKDGHNYFIALATYQKALAPESVTEISLSQIALDPYATNADVAAFDKTYNVLVHAQGIQSDGFGDVPEDALIEGFGRDIPFDLTLAQGVDLYTALHYYGGNKEDAKITDKVASVTFGLNNAHEEIVSNTNNRAVFTSVEQDAEVYTYYVPNATDSNKYDLYVLADDTIYTPKNSTGLFQGMTSLTTVNTTNMDVSRTEDMSYLFCDCSKLTILDTSNWNTTNVTTMERIFQNCSSLSGLVVSGWNVGNVKSFRMSFSQCYALTTLSVGTWDTSSVTDMYGMFNSCNNLNGLSLSKWKTGNVTDMSFMFRGCRAFEQLDDISDWDVSKVTTFERFLSSDNANIPMKLKSIDLSAWETDSLENANWMFQNCNNMTTANLHGWNLSKATDMAAMFEFCRNLKNIDVGGWTFGNNIKDLGLVFRHCQTLEVVDLSSWSTASATSMWYLFEYCYKLQTVYVGDGWNMDNVTQTANMFVGCYEITGQNGTVYDSTKTAAEYAHVDEEENPGYFTHIKNKPAESEQN